MTLIRHWQERCHVPLPTHLPSTTPKPEDSILTFDPDVDAFKLEQACNPESPQLSFPESNGPVSPYLLAHCKH